MFRGAEIIHNNCFSFCITHYGCIAFRGVLKHRKDS
jgi:hypothetical protein